MKQTIAVDVVEEDGLNIETDVLVLKHAQALYGLDAEAVAQARVSHPLLPLPGETLFLRRPPNLGARNLMFLGTPSIGEFEYSHNLDFGRRAIASVGRDLPDAKDIALTIHGVGFGLDEMVCFETLLAGIFAAVDAGEAPPSLTRIRVVELSHRRAERLRKRLAEFLPSGALIRSGSAAQDSLSARVDRLVGDQQRHAFVAMPFAEEFDDTFHYGITSAVHSAGLTCERIDRQVFTGDIVAHMKERIRTASLVVADVTGANANVYLEVGMAWGLAIPAVLVMKDDSALKFDIQGQRCLFYKSIKDLEAKLTKELAVLTA